MASIKFSRVKVVNEKESWLGTKCYIDGQEIDRVRAVDFRVAVDEIPTFDFEMFGAPEIDMVGDIRFSFTPKTVEEAVKVLRNELKKNEDFYNGFRASIVSAIKDSESGIYASQMAENILKRIIGEEITNG